MTTPGPGRSGPDQREGGRVLLGLFDVGDLRIGIETSALSEVCMASKLLPIITPRTDVLGMLPLRGSMIPVVDLLAICGKGSHGERRAFVAIVQHAERLIGLSVDRSCGIAAFDSGDIQELYSENTAAAPIVKRGLHDDGVAINMIEVEGIFACSDMPSCPARHTSTQDAARRGRVAYLTFDAGRATFGMDAISIFGTVPGQVIDPGPVAGSSCLGMITYLDRKVPVIDCAKLVGLGTSLSTATPEVVVVRLDNDELVGLAVDRIRQIEFIDNGTLRAPPPHLHNLAALVSSFFLIGDGMQVFILQSAVLQTVPDIKTVAALSRLERSTEKFTDENPSRKAPTAETRCLVYTAGRRQASTLTDVVSIISMPDQITPVPSAHQAVDGFFVHLGESILLVDLARLNGGHVAPDRSNSRVLIVEGELGEVGFRVDSVDGIQTSDFRMDNPGDPLGPVARLGRGTDQYTLPYLDLTATATKLAKAV